MLIKKGLLRISIISALISAMLAGARALAQQPSVEARAVQTAVTLKDLALAFDKNRETRATSGTPNYAGMSFTFDLGGEYELSRIAQLHGQWAEDYPSEYKVEVSRQKNESKFREIWRGRGEPGRSVARFNPVITRYIRITALDRRDRTHWWSIAEVRTNRDPDVAEDDYMRLDRTIRRVTARGLSNIDSVLDEDPGTHATTGSPNYADSWVLLDLGGSYTISNVVQVHDPNDRDFPGRYRIEVSEAGSRWQTVWEGEGQSGRSRANFVSVRARFVRIIAMANKNNRDSWSISKVRVSG